MIMVLVWLLCKLRTTALAFRWVLLNRNMRWSFIVLWCIIYLDATVQSESNTPAFYIVFQASLITRVTQKYLSKGQMLLFYVLHDKMVPLFFYGYYMRI